MKHTFLSAGALGACFFLVILLPGLSLSCFSPPAPLPPLEKGVYIWQFRWTPEVEEAVLRAAEETDHFLVLAAELHLDEKGYRWQRAAPRWEVFDGLDVTLTAVIRAGAGLRKTIHEDPGEAADILGGMITEVLDATCGAGLEVNRIQIDYDCPTSAVGDYALLMKALRSRFEGVRFSITALPDWLRSPDFQRLAEAAGAFTLQVHGLERPEHIDAIKPLCDTSRISGWIQKAARTGIPFHVALPSCGYRLYFDGTGAFTGGGAEGTVRDFSGYMERRLSADPLALAGAVRNISVDRPANLKGLVWFRLPVEGDRLNWTWPVLAGVMRGEAPRADIRAEVRIPAPGLYEIWIENKGAYQPDNPVTVSVRKEGAMPAARDCVNGFTESRDSDGHILLQGMAPPPGEKRLAAWYRLKEPDEKLESKVTAECMEVEK